jgi:uncharacterized protein (DUF1697 family)
MSELEAGYGLRVPVLVRTAAAWKALVEAAPFAAEGDADGTKVHVGFLPAPASAGVRAFPAEGFRPERMALVGDEIHLHLPGGMGRSKLAAALARTANADDATFRNWKSVAAVTRLLERL